MGLPISVYVSDGDTSYSLDLSVKVAIIYSGIGKSTLYKLVADRDYSCRISDELYEIVAIPSDDWKKVYSGYLANSKPDKKYIFIFDDVGYVESDRFVELFRSDDCNLYIMINKLHKLKDISRYFDLCNTSLIYNMVSDGYKHHVRCIG